MNCSSFLFVSLMFAGHARRARISDSEGIFENMETDQFQKLRWKAMESKQQQINLVRALSTQLFQRTPTVAVPTRRGGPMSYIDRPTRFSLPRRTVSSNDPIESSKSATQPPVVRSRTLPFALAKTRRAMVYASDYMAQDGLLYDGWGAKGMRDLNTTATFQEAASAKGMNLFDAVLGAAQRATDIYVARHDEEPGYIGSRFGGDLGQGMRKPRRRNSDVMIALEELVKEYHETGELPEVVPAGIPDEELEKIEYLREDNNQSLADAVQAYRKLIREGPREDVDPYADSEMLVGRTSASDAAARAKTVDESTDSEMMVGGASVYSDYSEDGEYEEKGKVEQYEEGNRNREEDNEEGEEEKEEGGKGKAGKVETDESLSQDWDTWTQAGSKELLDVSDEEFLASLDDIMEDMTLDGLLSDTTDADLGKKLSSQANPEEPTAQATDYHSLSKDVREAELRSRGLKVSGSKAVL